jgi:preprotein translocase subunit SecD
MQATWWTRLAIVVVVLLWGVWSLIPTFLGESTQDMLSSQASDANAFNDQAEVQVKDEDLEADSTDLETIADQIVHARGELSGFDTHAFENDEEVFTIEASDGADVDLFTLTAEKTGELEVSIKWSDWLANDKVTWTPRDTDYAVDASGVRRVRSDRLKLLSRVDGQEDRYLTDRMVVDLQITDTQSGRVFWEGDTRLTYGNFSTKIAVEPDTQVTIRVAGAEILGRSVEQQNRKYQVMVRLIEKEVELPWWASLLPESRISLGLDLQGGIDFTLGVQVMEAVNSAIQRDVKPIKDESLTSGISLLDVQRLPNEDADEADRLLILTDEGVSADQVDDFMSDNYNVYERTGEISYLDQDGWLVYSLTVEQVEYIKDRAMEQALETLRSRIDETGVKEPSITQKGQEQINVQLPGMDNVEDAMAAIGTAAVLEFMPVHEDEMKKLGELEKHLKTIENEDPDRYNDDEWLSNRMKQLTDASGNPFIPKDARLMWEYGEGQASNVRQQYYVLYDEVILTGDDVNDAHVSWNQFNEPYVALEFKAKGGRIFAEYTGQHVGDRFAIVLDSKVRSAPVIREKIGGGRASIEMGSGDNLIAKQEASVLALVLRTGALPAPVTIDQVRTVGATLGADAIEAGRKATVVGFVLVLIFMVLYYKKAGVVSVLALVCNLMLVMALLATVGATLTLPGIAGIALTVGMAVDCNIIIFERIREEKALGKNARAATDAGFSKAFLAVIDANITTFIAGVVLYTYGTGPIKGFAVTLMIGILTTLFTGIFLSRTIMDWMTRKTSARLSI